MTLSRCVRFAALAAVSATLMLGCSSTPKPLAHSALVFYPPPPDHPRLQFLFSFSSAKDWSKPTTSFAQWIVGGKQPQEPGQIGNPYGVAAHDGKIYICDLGRHMVHIVDLVHKTYGVLGNGEEIKNPVNIVIAPDGTKYVCDTQKNQVVVFNAQDQYVTSLGDPRKCMPSDLVIGKGVFYVTDLSTACIQVWSPQGKILRTISRKGQGMDELEMPTNLTLGPDGNLYVVDTILQQVKVFDTQGHFIRTIGEPGDRPGNFARPKGLAIDEQGHMYVADAQWGVVQVFSTEGADTGRLLLIMGYKAKGAAEMDMPTGVTIDRSSLPYVQSYLAPGFVAKYLLFVTDENGINKVGVYAYGHMKDELLTAVAPAKTAPAASSSKAPAIQPTTKAPDVTAKPAAPAK